MQHGQIEKSVAQPSGAATPEEADARHRRASASSGCSFGGDFAGSTKPHCGRGREGPCFGVWAVVCDPLSKAECVPAFARESKRGAFVGEVEKRKREFTEKREYARYFVSLYDINNMKLETAFLLSPSQ